MKCIHCNGHIRQEISFSNIFSINAGLLCKNCLNRLERVSGGCKRCGKKTKEAICLDCKFWEQHELTKMFQVTNYSLFYYNSFAKELINKIKFSGDVKLIIAFKEMMKKYLKTLNLKDLVLVPVPMHEKRLNERGFNQSLAICKCLPYPVIDVVRRLDNEKQSKKSRQERIQFNRQYELINQVNLHGKKIMIVDDLYTTGATIHKVGYLFVGKTKFDMFSFTLFRS